MDDVEDMDHENGLDAEQIAPSMTIITMALQQAAMARRISDFDAAIAAYSQVLEVDPEWTEALLGIAQCHHLSGRPRLALQTCVKLLEIDPRHVGARLEMAEALRLIGRADEAHAIHDLLLHERPDSPHTWCGLAHLLTDESHSEAAETCLRRALALAPAHVQAHAALARLLARRDEHGEAVDCFHNALALAPDDPAHHSGLALSLIAMGRQAEAAERLDRALALDEEWVEARLARADLAVMAGHLNQSWEDSQWRWHQPGAQRPDLPGTPWEGEDLDGGLLLVHAETSLSDTLRLIRFVPLLAQRSARIVLVVPPALIPLLTGMVGLEVLLADNTPIPVSLEISAYAALPDLPRLLGLAVDSLPATSWLEAPPRRRRPILVPPDTALKVGLAWAGNDCAASISFPLLLPLAEIPGVVLFSLEFSRGSEDAALLADPSLVTDFSPTVVDFADLAGRIAELDLIIAGDCATAHLAGAMNKPVLLMLPFHCHPRWMQSRDHSPWYPAMRLFRQDQSRDWHPVIAAVMEEMKRLAVISAGRNLHTRQRSSGSAAMQAAFLAAHLNADHLLVDVQAGDGVCPAPPCPVLAVEPHAGLAEDLTDPVIAALGDSNTPILIARFARHGRRVFALPEGIAATARTRRLDSLLDERPELASRPLALRLGQIGWESAILAGLGAYHASLVVLEHRPNSQAAAVLSQAGFSLWRFPTPTAMGSLVPFAGESGAVLALAEGQVPAAHYGPQALPPSPQDVAEARAEAERLTTQGLAHQGAGRLGEAAESYAQALMRDPFAASANANKGVMMHLAGRREAAISCYRRSLIRTPGASVAANLATALREVRRFDEADTALAQALATAPADMNFLYDLALLRRDQGRLGEAIALLRRIRYLRPGAQWALAQVLVATGEMEEGFDLFRFRPGPPPPRPDLPAWTGDDLLARSLLLHQNCDLADAVMMTRFIPLIASRGGLVTLICQPELAPLMQDIPGIELVLGPDETPPDCDLRAALTDLPRLLGRTAVAKPQTIPYLSLPGLMRPRRHAKDQRLRVGLAWGGRPLGRACPLSEMLPLAQNPDLALIALVDEELQAEIESAGAHGLVEQITPSPLDLAETAAIIATLDVVVGGDTPEIHLAAAMGKPTWLLLPDSFTWRWPQGRDDSPWYPQTRLFRQSPTGAWRPAVNRIGAALTVLAAKKRG